MTIWQDIRRRLPFSPAKNEVSEPVATSLIVRGSDTFDAFTGGLATALSEETAMTVSAIYAAINLKAGAIAALPVNIFSQTVAGERDKLPDDGLWWVLNEQFNARWSAAHGWEFLQQSLMLHGNAYAEILRRQDGAIRGLTPLHPRRVSVGVWPDGERLAYAVQPDPDVRSPSAKVRVIDQDDMIHVAGLGFDGVTAPSPLRHSLRMTGGVAQAAQQFSSQFFENSARPDYALKTEQTLGPEKVEELRAQIDERHRGPYNAGRPMVLTNGLDLKVLTMPLEDMQLLETRKFQIEEIARVYGIPPFMLGHNEKTTSWGSGVEAMGVGFVRYSLRQDLNKFTNEINRKFFRTARRVVEFDTTELERADTKSLFESFRIALGRAGEPGFMTTEEVRDRLNLKRKPDGTLNPGAKNEPPAPPAGQ